MERRLPARALAVAGHAVGVATVASLLWLLALGSDAGAAAAGLAGHPALREAWQEIAIHLGLSAGIWAMGCLVWHRLNRRDEPPRVVKLDRGTTMVEFLILLVPFLLLVSGLGQLSILNTAGLLADVAAYNAGRAVWVWEPRDGVTQPEVLRHARVAAAAALAPSAPADFSSSPDGAVQPLVNELGGGAGAGGPAATGENMYYNVAFDTVSFQERTAKKLYFAYAATRVTSDFGNPLEVQMTYQMNVVFPWFAYIWGRRGSVGGRAGYYVPIRRTYSLPRQLRAAP